MERHFLQQIQQKKNKIEKFTKTLIIKKAFQNLDIPTKMIIKKSDIFVIVFCLII